MPNERRIVELVLKAVGDKELKAITRDLVALKQSAEASQASLAGIGGNITGAFSLAKKALAAFGIYETIVQIVGVAQRAIDQMDELAVTISKVGVAAGDLQKLQYAAALSNVGLDDLNKGLVKLSVNMADLKGKGGFVVDTLRKLGVEAGTGTLEAMKKIADQFEKMPDGAQKTALAVALFGKAGAELIPLLNSGSDGLAAMAAEAEGLGAVLSGEALAGANNFNDEIDKMTALVGGAVKQIMGGMAPALITIAKLLVGAASTGANFAAVGAQIGDAMIDAAKAIAYAGSYVQSFLTLVAAAERAAVKASEGFRKSFTDPAAAERAFVEAGQAGALVANTWNNMGSAADAAAQSVHNLAQETKYQTRLAGRLLDRGGTGGGADDLAASGGDKGSKGDKGAAAAKRAAAAAAREAAKAAKAEADAIADLNSRIVQNNALMEKNLVDIGKAADAYNRAADPTIAYAEGIKALNDAQRMGQVTAAAYALELERLADVRDKATQALLENSKAERARVKEQEKHKEALAQLVQQWQFVGDAVQNATYDILTGAESIAQAIRRMVATIVAEFLRMQLVALANKVLGSFLQSAGVPLFSANGNAFGAGGVISTPTMHGIAGGGIGIAGEAGPEAIMPLKRGSDGKLGVAAGGGGISVVVNNMTPADVGVRQTDPGLQIDVIERQLADRVRRGGTSLPGAIENTYRSGRQASAY
jgi:hypothetical protein